MPTSIQPINQARSLFFYLLFLTFIFVLVEISLFLQSSLIYLGDFKLIANQIKIPHVVLPGILYYVSVLVLLHVLFAIFIGWLAWSTAFLFKLSRQTWGQYLWLMGISLILLANQIYYPNSKFAELTSLLIPNVIAIVIAVLLSVVMTVLSALALFRWVGAKIVLMIAGLSFILGFLLQFNNRDSLVIDAGTRIKPNLIIIGIDSLRPDFLSYFGYSRQTPALDSFLKNAVIFSESLTPIARTFPAWFSILSGQYPKNSHVRYTLAPVEGYAWKNTLPHLLRQDGYKTIFATDETRFSNIDQRYGFDQVITPPTGFNDFLLGSLNDFPMANLLINTPLGKYLFPYSYANRPANVTYNPSVFLKLLGPELSKSRDKPLFLAVHFCLPHFPYIWGGQKMQPTSLENYQAALSRVDRQFADFLNLLDRANLLRHSVVVLISDHGEGLELPGDRITEANLFIGGKKVPHFYPKSFDTEEVNQSAGHGTDVLGLPQYHTVLAFREYGLTGFVPRIVKERVSLLDIKPTLLTLLKHSLLAKDDGHSLVALLSGGSAHTDQHFFMETDFSPQAIRSVHPETRQLLFEGINFFQIDSKTAHLSVKEKMGKLIISSKQYADIYQHWILALYPQDSKKYVPILVNLRTGYWTDNLDSAFARKSPAQHMLHALQDFYGEDLKPIEGLAI